MAIFEVAQALDLSLGRPESAKSFEVMQIHENQAFGPIGSAISTNELLEHLQTSIISKRNTSDAKWPLLHI